MRLPGTVGSARGGFGAPAGAGRGRVPLWGGSGGGPVSSLGWGGGEAAVGAAGQVPAALMDRPVMSPAQQGQVGQVGGAAMQPVAQMVGFAPAERAVTAGNDTAAVADGQGGPLGGLDDPAGPADLQRLGAGAAQDWGQQGHRGPQPPRHPSPGEPEGAECCGSPGDGRQGG
jgi:hypothetical protein